MVGTNRTVRNSPAVQKPTPIFKDESNTSTSCPLFLFEFVPWSRPCVSNKTKQKWDFKSLEHESSLTDPVPRTVVSLTHKVKKQREKTKQHGNSSSPHVSISNPGNLQCKKCMSIIDGCMLIVTLSLSVTPPHNESPGWRITMVVLRCVGGCNHRFKIDNADANATLELYSENKVARITQRNAVRFRILLSAYRTGWNRTFHSVNGTVTQGRLTTECICLYLSTRNGKILRRICRLL